jgi:peroxiredoxin
VKPKPSTGLLAAIFMIVAGLLVIVLSVTWAIKNRTTPSQLPEVGRALPDFNLPDLDGKMVRLSDYRGRPVLINFWATWCPPCRAEMDDLEAFYYDHQKEGLMILAVNSGESRDIAAEFAQELGLSFTVLLDEDFTISDQWLINSLPTSILVDRDGVVQVIHVGLFSAEQMDEELLPHLTP